jgi:hypothetical protein
MVRDVELTLQIETTELARLRRVQADQLAESIRALARFDIPEITKARANVAEVHLGLQREAVGLERALEYKEKNDGR